LFEPVQHSLPRVRRVSRPASTATLASLCFPL
jgi:hypothetical protein